MTPLDLTLVPALYASFDDGSLRLHYQPEVDLRNGSVPGMQAHPRWAHPDLGLLGPADFMPIAEAAGLASQVHQWVLRMAITEVRTWHRMAAGTQVRPPRLWVRVDGRELARPDFVTEVERLVRGRALPAGSVGLQFTEETLAFADPGTPRLLVRLRALGVAVGVDSFGTWYGSLATLDLLPLDLVRIDGRFLRATLRDLEGESAFASMMELVHRRRMIAVADGVDTAAMAARVAKMNCDRVAGPLFCPPVPVEDARMIALGRGRPDRWYRPPGDSWGATTAGPNWGQTAGQESGNQASGNRASRGDPAGGHPADGRAAGGWGSDPASDPADRARRTWAAAAG